MRVVILDRDGVINRDSPEYIKSPEEWHPLPGSLEAIARLCAGGYRLALASNQSGVGRGLFDLATLQAIHDKMAAAIRARGGRLEAVAYCPHAPGAGCGCRKPRPGLLRQVARELGVNLEGVPCIGDSRRDLQAASAVAARPILVLTGNGRQVLEAGEAGDAEVYDDLSAAADALLRGATE